MSILIFFPSIFYCFVCFRIENVPCGGITVAITICGNNSLSQGVIAIKSALILSDCHIHFVIMTDKQLFPILKHKVSFLMKTKINLTFVFFSVRRIQNFSN